MQSLITLKERSIRIYDNENRALDLHFKRYGNVKSLTLIYVNGYQISDETAYSSIIPEDFRPIEVSSCFSVSSYIGTNTNYKFKLIQNGTLVVFSDGTSLSNNMEYTHTYF
ncbi:MAG: hypothetical protein RSD40_03390 [Bacilli bacterium]